MKYFALAYDNGHIGSIYEYFDTSVIASRPHISNVVAIWIIKEKPVYGDYRWEW